MRGNKGFTLLELVLAVMLISTILLVLASMGVIYSNTWQHLRDTGERHYAMRTASTFFYREIRLVDRDKVVRIDSSTSFGNRLNYTPRNTNLVNYINISQPSASLRHYGGTHYIVADNIDFIHFTDDTHLLYIILKLGKDEIKLVIPWE